MKAIGFDRPLPISDSAALLDIELPTPELLPHDVLVEVRSIKVPQTSAEDGKLIRTRLAEHTAIGMYNGLTAYLKGKIPAEQGKQKLDGAGH